MSPLEQAPYDVEVILRDGGEPVKLHGVVYHEVLQCGALFCHGELGSWGYAPGCWIGVHTTKRTPKGAQGIFQ